MTRIATISTAILVALSVYIGVYLAMSLHGHYEPNYIEPVYGPDTPNEYLLKAAEPLLWWPNSSYVSDAIPSFQRVFFRPLIYLDRTFWHTSEKANSGPYHKMLRYPVRGYLNEDTMEYQYF